MSLDKAIEHKKEKRKKYRHSEAFDKGCRPRGKCSYCRDNRLHRHSKQKRKAETSEEE
jgi:hypothetical protein